jgi:hypothetical protein
VSVSTNKKYSQSLHELGQKELDFVQGKLFELIAEVVLDSDGIRVFEEVRDPEFIMLCWGVCLLVFVGGEW